MRQPRGLTFPEGSSPRAALARRQKTLHGALAETSSRGRRARDDEIRLRRLAGGTATNCVREPRRRIARARGSLLGLRSVPATARRGEKLAKIDALGQAAMPTRRSCRCRWLWDGRESRSSAAPTNRPPPRRLPALRTFPRDCRPTCAALGGGAGGETMSPGRRPLCGEERCCCCDQYAAYRGREVRPRNLTFCQRF